MLKSNCQTQAHTLTHTTNHSQHTQSIRIFTSNVRGIIRHWDAIKQINSQNYDILLFNEIWQIRDYENLSKPEFTIANIYQRENVKGGGVIIFVRNSLKFQKIDSPLISGVIETTAITIGNTIITSLYKPPSGNKHAFKEALSSWVETLNNKNVYISGDFNINYLTSDKTHFDQIENTTTLVPQITSITRLHLPALTMC
jgi:hypothetical protein